ncbi:MAG: class I poly(R)-hydroxyalkanoic acid synthase, partial [Pseudomonadota bacterium]
MTGYVSDTDQPTPKKPAKPKRPSRTTKAAGKTPAKATAKSAPAATKQAAPPQSKPASAPANSEKPAKVKAEATAKPATKAKAETKPKTAPQSAAKPRPDATAKPQEKPADPALGIEDLHMPDATEWSRNMMHIAARSQQLVREFMQRNREPHRIGTVDPLNVANAFMHLLQRMVTDPGHFIDAQLNLWKSHLHLWQSTTRRLMGEEVDPVIEPRRGDKRFRHPDWQENEVFDFVKQSYLLTARWLQQFVGEVEGLDQKERAKIDFYTRQFADAIAPSNFLFTNPEVLRATIDSKGENLIHGLEHMIQDLERGRGKLAIRQTDLEHFQVGKNVATTPGKVVFEDPILQLIQYSPTTESVHETPIVFFTPWINKFYILDLRPENSLIKWMVDQGHTVFVTSWVNPGPELAGKTFEDYMREGIFEVVDVVKEICEVDEVNTVGYCIGGTLLGSTLAYMSQKGKTGIRSATFFTAQLDFSEAG